MRHAEIKSVPLLHSTICFLLDHLELYSMFICEMRSKGIIQCKDDGSSTKNIIAIVLIARNPANIKDICVKDFARPKETYIT